MWNEAVITNAGAQILADWLEGGTLNISGASVGTGSVSPSQLRAQTALVNEQHSIDIVKGEKVTGGVRLKLQLTSEGITTGFTINQIGIYAQLDGGSTVLTALYQDSTGIDVPTEALMPDFVFTFWAVVATNNEGTLTINLTPGTQIEVVDNLTSTSSTDALSAKQGKVLSDAIAAEASARTTALAGKIDTTEKGAANGVATLDGNGRIPYSQLPESAMEYKGTWNASTNTPHLADGTGMNGDFYIVSVAGTFGGVAYAVNDRIIYDGTQAKWIKLAGGSVSSVAGRTGAVTLTAADIGAGTLAGKVQANATAQATLANAQVRNIYAGTTDMIAGTTPLESGSIYIMYEA